MTCQINRVISLLFILQSLFALTACTRVPAKPVKAPMADVHIHFNWNQEEIISAAEVIEILRQHQVVMTVVSSRPSANALKLRKAGGDWIIPIYSPYYKPGIKQTWYRDLGVLEQARAALATGQYRGIGEMHLVSGMGPNRNNPVVTGLIGLARQYELPVLIHTDAARYEYFAGVCRQHPDVRFLWAHAGGILDASQVDALMGVCANVWVELSARDPWHYGLFTDSENKLLPGWKTLFEKYPTRFMTGTDPVWNAHQTYRWYEADEGWSHYTKLNNYHRHWMNQLTPQLESNIRLKNAQAFFNYVAPVGARTSSSSE